MILNLLNIMSSVTTPPKIEPHKLHSKKKGNRRFNFVAVIFRSKTCVRYDMIARLNRFDHGEYVVPWHSFFVKGVLCSEQRI